MGTDIHGFWEVQTAVNNWVAVKHVKDIRNYLWFSIIGGVRGACVWPDIGKMKFNIQSPPWFRGIPENASSRWKQYAKGDWLHSSTWLTVEEVTKANKIWKNDSIDDLYHHSYSTETPVPQHLRDDYEKILIKTTVIEQLFIGQNIEFPWFGTVNDLVYKKYSLNECIRMVVGFDS